MAAWATPGLGLWRTGRWQGQGFGIIDIHGFPWQDNDKTTLTWNRCRSDYGTVDSEFGGQSYGRHVCWVTWNLASKSGQVTFVVVFGFRWMVGASWITGLSVLLMGAEMKLRR